MDFKSSIPPINWYAYYHTGPYGTQQSKASAPYHTHGCGRAWFSPAYSIADIRGVTQIRPGRALTAKSRMRNPVFLSSVATKVLEFFSHDRKTLPRTCALSKRICELNRTGSPSSYSLMRAVGLNQHWCSYLSAQTQHMARTRSAHSQHAVANMWPAHGQHLVDIGLSRGTDGMY